MKTELKSLYMGDLRVRLPIIQGGMGVRVSTAPLVSAVSNEGGLGVIAAVGLGEREGAEKRDYVTRSRASLAASIRETRRMTKNPFGVNIMCALTNYDDLVDIAQKESADVIISGAGLPLKLPSLIKNENTKLVPIVSSARAAYIICSAWRRRYNRLPDAVIVEGPLAGGHLGYSRTELDDPENFFLEKILKEVLLIVRAFENDKHKIPVIAAGGIFDGEDIAKAILMGASAVQMATRFVCTRECSVSDEYKKAYIAAREEDIIIIQSPVGMPGRVIRNKFVERISRGEKIDFGCEYKCLSTCDAKKVNYCIAKALLNASNGKMDNGFAMCGSNAHRINEIVSVKQLVAELTREARRYLNRQPALRSGNAKDQDISKAQKV